MNLGTCHQLQGRGAGGKRGGLDIFVHEKRVGQTFLCNINTCPARPRRTIKPTDKNREQ
jgi:hypothetical protein